MAALNFDDILGNVGPGANDIAAFQNKVAANDIWSLLGSQIAGAKFNTSTWTPGESMGVTALNAFLGSALASYGANQQAAQLEKVASVMPQLYTDPMAAVAPEGVDTGAFTALKLGTANRRGEALSKLMSEVKLAGAIEEAKTKGVLTAKNEFFKDGGIDPEKIKLIRDEEDAARKEISEMEGVSFVTNAETSLSRMKPHVNDPTKSSDVLFVKGLVSGMNGKLVKDPNSGYSIEGADSLPGQLKGMLEGALNGGSTIGVEGKQQFYDQFMAEKESALTKALEDSKTRLATATGRGGKAENILPAALQRGIVGAKEKEVETPKLTGLPAGITQEAMISEAARIKAAYPQLSAAERSALLRKSMTAASIKRSASGVPLG